MTKGTRRLLIAMVIVGHALLAVAASSSSFLQIIDAPVTLTLAQMNLLSLWVSFGHGNQLLRWSATLVGGLCLAGLDLWAYSDTWPSSDVGWFVAGAAAVTFAPVLCVTIPSHFVRKHWAEVSRPDELSQTRPQLQFSLRHLLGWITTWSLLLALCRFLAGVTDELGQFPSVILFAGLAGFVFGSVSLASLWASLAEGRPLVRAILVTMFAAAGGMMASYASGSSGSWITWVFASTSVAIVINLTLLAFRAAGYRVVRKEALQV